LEEGRAGAGGEVGAEGGRGGGATGDFEVGGEGGVHKLEQRLQARQLVFDFLEALGLFISGSKDKYEFYDKFSVYPSSLNASKIISLCSDNDHAKPRIETATTLFRECNWNTLQDLDKITDDAKSEAFYDAHPNKYDALDKSNDNVSSFLLCIERFKPNKKRKRNT
jgi:hypothetical protein